MFRIPTEGGTGKGCRRCPLGSSSPFAPHTWGGSLELPPGQAIQREQALVGRKEVIQKANRPPQPQVVAREDATSLSLIAELSSPPRESRENGYFWKSFPSL